MFSRNSISDLTLGDNIEIIGEGAFENNPQILKVLHLAIVLILKILQLTVTSFLFRIQLLMVVII